MSKIKSLSDFAKLRLERTMDIYVRTGNALPLQYQVQTLVNELLGYAHHLLLVMEQDGVMPTAHEIAEANGEFTFTRPKSDTDAESVSLH